MSPGVNPDMPAATRSTAAADLPGLRYGTTIGAITRGRPADDDASADIKGREHALVLRAIAGDRAAFGQLYERTVDDVYAYIKLRVREGELAEDLTQDVYLRALRALDTFEWRGSLLPWLVRIAHNRIANHWRSLGRSPQLAPLPDDDPSQPRVVVSDLLAVADAEPVVVPRELEHGLQRLTELQREVIALRFGAGLSLAETAALMGRTTNAVKNLQHNALAALRRRLGLGHSDAGPAGREGSA